MLACPLPLRKLVREGEAGRGHLQRMRVAVMAHTKRVGDRVIVTGLTFEGRPLQGRLGTVIAKSDYLCVLFDQPFEYGHDGNDVGANSGIPWAVRRGRCRHGFDKELRYIGRRVNVRTLV